MARQLNSICSDPFCLVLFCSDVIYSQSAPYHLKQLCRFTNFTSIPQFERDYVHTHTRMTDAIAKFTSANFRFSLAVFSFLFSRFCSLRRTAFQYLFTFFDVVLDASRFVSISFLCSRLLCSRLWLS